MPRAKAPRNQSHDVTDVKQTSLRAAQLHRFRGFTNRRVRQKALRANQTSSKTLAIGIEAPAREPDRSGEPVHPSIGGLATGPDRSAAAGIGPAGLVAPA